MLPPRKHSFATTANLIEIRMKNLTPAHEHSPQPYLSPLLAPTFSGPSLTSRAAQHYVVAPMGKPSPEAPSYRPKNQASSEPDNPSMWDTVSSGIFMSMMGHWLGFGHGLEMLGELLIKTIEAGEQPQIEASGLQAAAAQQAMLDAKPNSQASLGYGLRTSEGITREHEARKSMEGEQKRSLGSGWSSGPRMSASMNMGIAAPAAPSVNPRPSVLSRIVHKL